MKKLFFISMIFIAIVGCQNKNTNQSERTHNDTSLVVLPEQKPVTNECFLSVMGKDSVFFETKKDGNSVKGFLFYKRFQTDGSVGYFNGAMYGDTLRGQYRFLSERMISYIDKVFLVKGNQLQEGIGAVKNPNDSTFVFVDINKVDFGKSYIFNKVDCKPEFISIKDKKFYQSYRTTP